LTLAFILSAARKGAVVCNYAEALYLTKESNKITGACVKDVLTNNEFRVQSKIVINAAGVWMDGINATLDQYPSKPKFNQSLAMNIIVPEVIQSYAAGLRSWLGKGPWNDGKHHSRMLFVSPWRGFSMAGTFHSFYSEKPDSFEVSEQTLQEMLDEVNSAYPTAKLDLNKIQFIHHGFLPAKINSNGEEVKLVRQGQVYDHLKEAGISGLISVMGVKYTSAREVAQKAVHRIYKHFGSEPPSCKSNSTRLLGGMIDRFDEYLSEIKQQDGQFFSPALIDDLVRSYGSEYPMIRELIMTTVPEEPLDLESTQVINALVHYSVSQEMAHKLSDFLLRRTGIGSAKKPSQSIIHTAATAMQRELGWSDQVLKYEIDELDARYPNFL
jgi:glycerol-3-phosphate dehydrogenase